MFLAKEVNFISIYLKLKFLSFFRTLIFDWFYNLLIPFFYPEYDDKFTMHSALPCVCEHLRSYNSAL